MKDAEPSWTQRMVTDPVEPETEAAHWFHQEYERLAPMFGYATRADTKKFDPESPNGKLMIAVCGGFRSRVRAAQHAATREACAEVLAAELAKLQGRWSLDSPYMRHALDAINVVRLEDAPCPKP